MFRIVFAHALNNIATLNDLKGQLSQEGGNNRTSKKTISKLEQQVAVYKELAEVLGMDADKPDTWEAGAAKLAECGLDYIAKHFTTVVISHRTGCQTIRDEETGKKVPATCDGGYVFTSKLTMACNILAVLMKLDKKLMNDDTVFNLIGKYRGELIAKGYDVDHPETWALTTAIIENRKDIEKFCSAAENKHKAGAKSAKKVHASVQSRIAAHPVLGRFADQPKRLKTTMLMVDNHVSTASAIKAKKIPLVEAIRMPAMAPGKVDITEERTEYELLAEQFTQEAHNAGLTDELEIEQFIDRKFAELDANNFDDRDLLEAHFAKKAAQEGITAPDEIEDYVTMCIIAMDPEFNNELMTAFA